MIFIMFILIILILIYLLDNPTVALIPYNLLITLISPSIIFYTKEQKENIFPASIELETNWKSIRNEAIGVFEYIQGNVTENFIKNKKNFLTGWNTFPLRMFGQNINVNMNMCPLLSKILNKHKDQIPTAFFSVMEPYKYLDGHYGPFKGILRYHLGLVIPPPKSGECYISVDDKFYNWKEGEGILFDETYYHFVHNNTPQHRIILFLDIKRPFKIPIMTFINDLILWIMKISPYNQKV